MTLRYELVIPILQIRKMRYREVKCLDHHLTRGRGMGLGVELTLHSPL